jgi:hypothetical protein
MESVTIDGPSPIRKEFDVSTYPLAVDFTLQTSGMLQSSILHSLNYQLPITIHPN